MQEGKLIGDADWANAIIEAAQEMISGLGAVAAAPPPARSAPPGGPPPARGAPSGARPPPSAAPAKRESDDDVAARAEGLIDAGMALESTGDAAGARAKYEQARAEARKITDSDWSRAIEDAASEMLSGLGGAGAGGGSSAAVAKKSSGNFDAALVQQCQALLAEAIAIYEEGRFDEALAKFEYCRSVGGKISDPNMVAAVTNAIESNVAHVRQEKAQREAAKAAEAAQAAAADADTGLVQQCQAKLAEGIAIYEEGRFDDALATFEQCRAIGRTIADPNMVRAVDNAVASNVDHVRGEQAQALLAEGQALYERGDTQGAAAVYGRCRATAEKISAANADQARELMTAAQDMLSICTAQTLLAEGHALYTGGDHDGALALFARVRAEGRKIADADQAAAVEATVQASIAQATDAKAAARAKALLAEGQTLEAADDGAGALAKFEAARAEAAGISNLQRRQSFQNVLVNNIDNVHVSACENLVDVGAELVERGDPAAALAKYAEAREEGKKITDALQAREVETTIELAVAEAVAAEADAAAARARAELEARAAAQREKEAREEAEAAAQAKAAAEAEEARKRSLAAQAERTRIEGEVAALQAAAAEEAAARAATDRAAHAEAEAEAAGEVAAGAAAAAAIRAIVRRSIAQYPDDGARVTYLRTPVNVSLSTFTHWS